MTTPDLTKAPILQGSSNYEAWQHWINTQCLLKGVNDVLLGVDKTPVADEGESPVALGIRLRTHKRELQFIEDLIVESCKEGPRALIASEKDPIKKFELLKSLYKRQGYTAREVCWRRLTRSSIDDFKNSSEYGQHLKQAATELEEMGFGCENWQLATTFLHGLGAEYDAHVSLILSNVKRDNTGHSVELNFDDVFRQIEDIDQRRKLNQNDDSAKGLKANKANTANFTTNNSGSARGGARGRGRGGRGGAGNTSESRGGSSGPLTSCDHCGRPHNSAICWLKYPHFASANWRKLNGAKIADFQKKVHMARTNEVRN